MSSVEGEGKRKKKRKGKNGNEVFVIRRGREFEGGEGKEKKNYDISYTGTNFM